MSVNESEHRRGLVLGFTLAEVMLLVLFLLLLGFGSLFATQSDEIARLLRVNDEARSDRAQLETLKPLLDELNKRSPGFAQNIDQLLARLRRVDELERAVTKLTEEKSRYESELTELRGRLEPLVKLERPLGEILKRASKLNPNDPIAALERGISVIEQAGMDVTPAELKKVGQLEAENAKLRKESKHAKGHTWPPLIVLKEADGYFFELGSSQLTEAFGRKLHADIVPLLLRRMNEYQVNVIEVVGHTDELPIRGRISNLDDRLIPFLHEEGAEVPLEAADNTGLGMARAVAVVRVLRNNEQLRRYQNQILPLSSGQLLESSGLLTDGRNPGSVKERRRIEIRLRRSPPEPGQ